MKLEFEHNIIPKHLYNELGFADYLATFNLDIPLIPYKVLRPMSKIEGTRHFQQLAELQGVINDNLILESIIEISKKLPSLDNLFPFYDNKDLQQYHLFSLGNFLLENETLMRYEVNFPLSKELGDCCNQIKKILDKYTPNNYSELKLSKIENDLQKKINQLDKKLADEYKAMENRIAKEIGLSMIHPYPKEIPLDSFPKKLQDKIEECLFLSINIKQDMVYIDYILPPTLRDLAKKKEEYNQEFVRYLGKKMGQINKDLAPYCSTFKAYYLERQNRSFYYSLLYSAHKNQLILPEFSKTLSCRLQGAQLKVLAEQKKNNYVPLDLEIGPGSNVLFGANMSGKTTVLKTLFFQLILIQMGLPLPAQAAHLHYPERVTIHLQSSGSIKHNLSSFGEEISFFAQKQVENSYILADELFQSTDPVSGPELSEIFLEEFAGRESIFFCTSHYQEVLQLGNISLFKMLDLAFDSEKYESMSLEELMGKIPYKMERLEADNIKKALEESRKPLYIALHFPLSSSLKEKITKRLKGK